MTSKRDEFEESLKNRAWKYAEIDDGVYSPLSWADYVEIYSDGARWSREQTIKEVLEALRSDPLIDGRRLELTCDHWADWLEQRFKGEK